MNSIKWTMGAISSLLLMAIPVGCEQQELPTLATPNPEGNTHTIEMVFTGERIDYGEIISKATNEWAEGDQLYLTFTVGSELIPGTAVYTGGKWKLTYEGELTTGQQNSCAVRHFTDCASQTSGLVTLKSSSAIYEALDGAYTYSNGLLTVNAQLKPKYGRLRFKGNEGEQIRINGINYNGTYSPLTCKYTSKSTPLDLTVEADGYTPYVYGEFKESNRGIGLVSEESAYTRYFTSDILSAGMTGFVSIPTPDNHNNWRTGLYIKLSDELTFRMIPVEGYSGGLYLLGETEVTQLLYSIVTGISVPKRSCPMNAVSYQSATQLIDKLNNMTGYDFCLPTYNQWLYAAKGGNVSQGYTYAGSNDIEEVAWYNVNSTEINEVKTKAPNELGFYDMSGNVSEWTSTLKDDAYIGSAIRAGGSYQDNAANCAVTAYAYKESSYITGADYGYGLRLCLNVNFN